MFDAMSLFDCPFLFLVLICNFKQQSGKITYCGHELHEFVPQKTCAYISQHDLHHGEMTVRETLDFSGRCLGVGARYELLAELSRREKAAGIKPDPELDAFMKAISISGQKNSLVTDYVLKVLSFLILVSNRQVEFKKILPPTNFITGTWIRYLCEYHGW